MRRAVHSTTHHCGGSDVPVSDHSKWFAEYAQQHPGVEINYQSIGSGGGIRQVTEGDGGFRGQRHADDRRAARASKVKLVHIPTVLGAVVPVYNLPGVRTDLQFAPDVLADIYLGKITNWNDARIAKDNPGVKLPNQEIYVIHRSDGSGTTYIFTDYLSKVSPEWKSSVGRARR